MVAQKSFKSITTFALSCVMLIFVQVDRAFCQQLSGLSIGESFTQTKLLGFPPSQLNRSGPFLIAKWDMPDGNFLSVTATADGVIVFLESNWGYGVSGRFTDFPGLVFGKTTLAEVRKLTGSNGFCFLSRGCVSDSGSGIVNFNSYGVSGNNNVVITFITVSDYAMASKDPSNAVLDSIIVGYKPYLNGIWGKEKISDPKYRPIKLK